MDKCTYVCDDMELKIIPTNYKCWKIPYGFAKKDFY